MNLQRLKFAWARGARIQIRDDEFTGGDWLEAPGFTGADFDYRIHPDDEHLQYGPVSTALRDMALYSDDVKLDWLTEQFMDMAGSNWWIGFGGSDIETDFARLFMAELLADEGL